MELSKTQSNVWSMLKLLLRIKYFTIVLSLTWITPNNVLRCLFCVHASLICFFAYLPACLTNCLSVCLFVCLFLFVSVVAVFVVETVVVCLNYD